MVYFNYISMGLICVFILIAALVKKKRPFSERFDRLIESRRFEIIFIAVVLIISAALRLIALSDLPAGMNQDEASIGYDSWAIANYGVDRNGYHNPVYPVAWGAGHDPFYMYAASLFIKLFGNSLFVYRLPQALHLAVQVLLGALAQDGVAVVEGMAGGRVEVVGAALSAKVGAHVRDETCRDDDVHDYALEGVRGLVGALVCQRLDGEVEQGLRAGAGCEGAAHERAMHQVHVSRGELHLGTLAEGVADARPEVLVGAFHDNLGVDEAVDGRLLRDEVNICRAVVVVEHADARDGRAVGRQRGEREVGLVDDGGDFLHGVDGAATAHGKEHVGILDLRQLGQLMGAGDAFAAKAIAEGKMTGTQFFMDKFTDKVISQGAAAFAEYAAMGPAGAFIVNALTGSVKPMAKEVLKAIQNEEVKQKAIVAAALLDAFYQRCNQRLKEEADKKDNTSWRLTASGKSKVERTLFGAPVMQNWTLKCDLRIEEDTEKPGGIYSGVMAVDITHDMTKFDGKFLSLVANELGPLPEAIQKARAVGNNIYDCWSTPSKLEKHLLAKRVRFVIPDNVAGYAKDAFIDEVGIRDFFQSKEDFWSLHPLWVVPNGVLPIMDQQGRYSFPGGSAGQFVAIWNLMGEIWDGFSPQIYLMSSDYIGWAHGKTWSIDNSQTTSGGVLKVNHDIFSDLESGGITLRMGWKGEEA